MFWSIFLAVLLVALIVNVVFVLVRFTVTACWALILCLIVQRTRAKIAVLEKQLDMPLPKRSDNVVPFRRKRPF